MGAVKDEMETTKDLRQSITDKVKEGLKGLRGKRSNGDPQTTGKTFADLIVEADTKLRELIAIKTKDLSTETSDVAYNRKALAHLNTMEYHLDEIANLAEEYGGLRK
jgi:uncharacterized protein YllA (UPF0747 family)